MPRVSDMIYSKYISKNDVETPIICTIRGVMLDSGGNRAEEPRWLMAFHELRKMLRLNNTTLRQLEATLGENSDAWIGARVRLYVDPTVTMAGQVVGGVRMQIGKRAAVGGAAAPAPRFDPQTGQPLQAPQTAPVPRFDPMTGQPLTTAAPSAPATSPGPREPEWNQGEVLPPTGHSSSALADSYEFDDEIPF